MTDFPLPDCPPNITLCGSFPPERECTFEHVPFELPQGVDQLLIDVTYNDPISCSPMERGGNTLDIGLFDQQGTESRSPGFRGWSGSVRTRLVIGTEWSVPPYRAGRPEGGTWHLLLGPYKVGPRGLNWEASIWLDPGIPIPDPQPRPDPSTLNRPRLPEAAEPGWYRGDLHMHTIYSDGTGSPIDVAVAAVEHGLDFFGITDHNRAQSPVGLVPQGDGWPVLVPGVEVTTYAGHFNVWGTDTWYDFRHPTAEGLQRAVNEALADGGTVSLNHPKPFGPEWKYPEVTGFHTIEAWNGWWAVFNAASLDWWHRRLGSPEPLPMVAGSDMHQHRSSGAPERPLDAPRIGYPTTWVQVPGALTADSILAAVREGRTFVSESPSGPQLFNLSTEKEIRLRVAHARGDALLLVGPHGVAWAGGITEADTVTSIPKTVLRDAL
ncbi:MAG TPA: CehA/McbA family metallohydrolase, partial [Thermomicrobiales bacterium]|nr:CehA/McbA family metallohydrolase [Thermomicrobiales bacterium]